MSVKSPGTTPSELAWAGIKGYFESTIGPPLIRALALGQAYQASDPTKAAGLTLNLASTAALTLSAGQTHTADIVIGPDATVAAGVGTVIGRYRNSLTGVLVIGLAINTDSSMMAHFVLPAGWYFAVRLTNGNVTITSAFEQVIHPTS